MAKKADIVPVADVKKLAEQRREATELVEFLESAPCDTPETEQWFSATLSSVRGLHKALEEQRTAITKPILASKSAVDALFAPVTKPLKQAEGIIREKLASAARARFAAEAESRRLAAEAAQEGRHEEVLDALASAPEHVATSGSSARVVRKWRCVDLAAVPREFLALDVGALDLAAKKGVESIPGIEFYDDVAVRAR